MHYTALSVGLAAILGLTCASPAPRPPPPPLRRRRYRLRRLWHLLRRSQLVLPLRPNQHRNTVLLLWLSRPRNLLRRNAGQNSRPQLRQLHARWPALVLAGWLHLLHM